MKINFRLCIVIGLLSQQSLNASFEDELCKQKNPLFTNRIEIMRQEAMYKAELMTSRLYYPQDMCFYMEEICLTSGIYYFASYVVHNVFNKRNRIHLFETYKDLYFKLYSIYQSVEQWRADYGHTNPRSAFAKQQYIKQQMQYLCTHLDAESREMFLENFSNSHISELEKTEISTYSRN